MKHSELRPVSVLTLLALVAPLLALTHAAAGGAHRTSARTGSAYEVRSLYTDEFGVARPAGVSWDPGRRALVVTAAVAGGGVREVSVTPGERLLGKSTTHRLGSPRAASFDPRSRRLVAPGVVGAVASSYTADGTRFVLGAQGTITRVSPRGAVERTRIRGLSGVALRGIAVHPGSRLRYVASADGRRIYAVDASGTVVRAHDVSRVGIRDLRGMTFAPSSDTTDDPTEQSLYVADRGDATVLGRVAEVSLTSTIAAAAPTTGATLVATRDTSIWSPPSPDPSGVTFMPGADRLLISDGEVDEMPIYAGANLFTAQRSSSLSGTGNTLTWSNEPTGVAFNPGNGHLFVSDDDKKSIFEIASAGADGRFGTADDGARTSFKTSVFGNTDPEDVAVDTVRGELLVIDGINSELFRVNAGPNGTFNGVAPAGDDIVTQYDLGILGAIDPNGVAHDAARDTILALDDKTATIYELDNNGSLLNKIDISSVDAANASGIAIAPASDGSGARNYYVVDRGLDNNSHPGENDGKFYELSASLPAITNRPPAANAGPDQMIDLPQTATLTGSAVDDRLPSNTLTYSWTKVSGPGTVTFGTPKAASTTATFSTVGAYVLRLKVSDSQLEDLDEVVVDVFQPGTPRALAIPIASGADDAMEGGGSSGKFVDLASADIELGHNGGTSRAPMLDGLRFAGIPVPPNGEIVSAKIQFKVDETGSEAASYTIRGEANDNAPTYQAISGNISARPSTVATVPWAPPAWTMIGEAGPTQLTPELKTIVQEVVNRPGWVQGNAVAFMIDGTGRRTAEAKDGLSPAVLMLQYRLQPPNTAPGVSAGLDLAVQLPAQAALDGTVTDDGQPAPVPSTAWSMVSGPGTVTFADPGLVDTTASVSAPGSYTLRLTANDGALSAFDDVVVEVEPADAAPVVGAGPDQAIQLPSQAALDGTLVDPGYSGPVSYTWSKVSGPGTVAFGNASALDTSASFSAAGSYTLRLTAANSALSSQDTMVVEVERADAAPVVGAGPDQAIQLPSQAALDGTLVDAGYSGPVSYTWSKVSGPGTVAFGNASALDTSASFSAPGSYTLRLTAANSALSSQDTMVVEVERADAAPVVSAGPDQSTRIPLQAALDGTLVDPGYPGPVQLQWTKMSGPGSVSFVSPTSADTLASFSTSGTYVLRLTSGNDVFSTSDDVQVVVLEPLLSLRLDAEESSVTALDEVGLTGTVTRQEDGQPVAGEEVEIWVTRAPGESPELLGTVTTGPDGAFALEDQPLVSSVYQAKAGEDASLPDEVAVVPRTTGPTAPSSVMVGQLARVRGAVLPAAAGQPVRLQRWNGTAWATVANTTVEEGTGRYAFVLATGRSGRWKYRVLVPAYAGRETTVSTPAVLEVYRARIIGVNTLREVVRVENTGRTRIQLIGWTLTDRRTGVTRVLRAFTLRPGRVVRIHSGSGIDDTNDLYLGRPPMWGSHGTAVVRNPQRFRVDRFTF